MQPIKVESRNSGSSQTSSHDGDWRVLGYAQMAGSETSSGGRPTKGAHNNSSRGSYRKSIIRGLAVFALVIMSAGGVLVATAPVTASSILADGRLVIGRVLGWAGLSVAQVSVSGHRYGSDIDIFDVLNKYVGTSLIGLNAKTASDDLIKLPWVRDAEVAREFPDELRVRIVERKPVAVWRVGGRFWLIDRDGEQLAQIGPGSFLELSQISGPGANKEIGSFLQLLKSVPVMAREVAGIKFIGGRRWTLTFKSGLVAHLPEREVLTGLKRLGQLLGDEVMRSAGLKIIDLRLRDKIALRHAKVLRADKATSRVKASAPARPALAVGTLTAADMSISSLAGERASSKRPSSKRSFPIKPGGAHVQY